MTDSKYFHKRHNVTVLIYHLVCPAKYRRVVFSEEVDRSLKGIEGSSIILMGLSFDEQLKADSDLKESVE